MEWVLLEVMSDNTNVSAIFHNVSAIFTFLWGTFFSFVFIFPVSLQELFVKYLFIYLCCGVAALIVDV